MVLCKNLNNSINSNWIEWFRFQDQRSHNFSARSSFRISSRTWARDTSPSTWRSCWTTIFYMPIRTTTSSNRIVDTNFHSINYRISHMVFSLQNYSYSEIFSCLVFEENEAIHILGLHPWFPWSIPNSYIIIY